MIDEKKILELLKYGERVNFECKKAEKNYQTRYGRLIRLLRIRREESFCLA